MGTEWADGATEAGMIKAVVIRVRSASKAATRAVRLDGIGRLVTEA